MHAVLAADPRVLSTITVPLTLTIALASLALVGVAVYVRRRRTTATLGPLNGGASVLTAVLVLAAALFISVSLGNAQMATAATGTTGVTAPTLAQLPITDDLDGFQLPTK